MKCLSISAMGLAICVLLGGCVSYHAGIRDAENFPGIARITAVNQTKDGEMAGILKRAMEEQMRTRPGLCARRGDAEGLNLMVTLKSQTTKNLARAEMRDEAARSKDDNAYQTVLSRVTVNAEFLVADEAGTELMRGMVQGQGDLPWMDDQDLAYRNACRLALEDVASQVTDALADAAWELKGE